MTKNFTFVVIVVNVFVLVFIVTFSILEFSGTEQKRNS